MDNIGTLLGHNIWQSVIIFAVVFAVLKLIKNSSAEERSWSWSATFFALALLPMAAFLPGQGVNLDRPAPVTDFSVLERSGPMQPVMTLPAPPKVKNKAKFESVDAPLFALPDQKQVLSGLLAIWLAGSVIALMRIGYASYNASRLRGSAYPFAGLHDGDWADDVEIAVSDEISSPIVIGVFKPLILIPRSFAYDMEYNDLKPLLYHELAHIKRGDTVLHLIERIVLAVYWWNPIMHVIARNIAEERELACDDRAADHCGDQLVYAQSLLKGARKLIGEKKPVLGLAVLRRESVLSKRVKRMAAISQFDGLNVSRFLKKITALLVAVVALGVVTPRIAVGQVDVDKNDLNSVEMIQDGLFVETEWKGDITLNEDESQITDLDEDGYFSVVTEQDGISRKLTVMPVNGELQSRYFVNGDEQQMNDQDLAWQANSIKAMLRLSGINADERVDSLFDAGGAKAVLDEMELLRSDYALRLYTEALVDIYDLNQEEVGRLIVIVDRIESPYEKDLALTSIADEQDLDDENAAHIAFAATGLGDPDIDVNPDLDIEVNIDRVVDIDHDIDMDIDIDHDIEHDIDIEYDIEAELEDIPSEEELQKMREEIERELENFPTEEDLAQMRQDALDSIPSRDEIEKMREDALADMMTEEELQEIHREAMESIPSVEEIEEMQRAAMESALSREEIEEIRREAMESIPSIEELREIQREALESVPTVEELEQIRRDAIEGFPTEEDLAQMRQGLRDALESLPTAEELEEMRRKARETTDRDDEAL